MDQLFVTLMSELLHQTGLLDLTLGNLVMIIAGCVLLYLGIITGGFRSAAPQYREDIE